MRWCDGELGRRCREIEDTILCAGKKKTCKPQRHTHIAESIDTIETTRKQKNNSEKTRIYAESGKQRKNGAQSPHGF